MQACDMRPQPMDLEANADPAATTPQSVYHGFRQSTSIDSFNSFVPAAQDIDRSNKPCKALTFNRPHVRLCLTWIGNEPKPSCTYLRFPAVPGSLIKQLPTSTTLPISNLDVVLTSYTYFYRTRRYFPVFRIFDWNIGHSADCSCDSDAPLPITYSAFPANLRTTPQGPSHS